MMVVKIAINSDDSCSNGCVSFGSIPHSSRSSSSQSWLSSASWSAPPSLDVNSSSDRAREASRTCAATEVPDRSSCLPRTRTSSRALGSLTYKRMTPAAKALVRSRNSFESRPFISIFTISAFYFPFSALVFSFYFGFQSCLPLDDALLQKNCGIALINPKRFKILRGDGTGGQHGMIANLDAGANPRAGANPSAIFHDDRLRD